MSDNDSSDSDISRGWTFVGQEGTVDSSSDQDSDIIVLRDEDFRIQNFDATESTEVKTEIQSHESQDEARVQRPEADSEFNEMDFHQKTTDAPENEENETPKTGLDVEKNVEILRTTEFERSKMSAGDDAPVSLGENLEASSSNLETVFEDLGEVRCNQMGHLKYESAGSQSEDTGSFSDETVRATGEAVESVSLWELADPEEPNSDYLPNSSLPASSCIQSGFMALAVEENMNAADGMCSESMPREGDVNDGNVNSDGVDEVNEDDDDESVVRKFHEATLHGSFNRHSLLADDRNESLQNHEEDEFLPPDADDRCESDISGVADDSDFDLSSLEGIDELQLHGDVLRTYRHQPNPKFNKCLTLIAATAMLFAVGIGIGHYFGSTRESIEYFACLHDVEKLESQIVRARDSDVQDKLTGVAAVWKKKYEQLVLEYDDLDHKLKQMQDKVGALLLLKGNYKEDVRKSEKTSEPGFSRKPAEQKQKVRDPSGTLKENKLKNKIMSADNMLSKELDHEYELQSWHFDVIHKLDFPVSSTPEYISEVKRSISFKENVTECSEQVNDLNSTLEKKNLMIGLLRNNSNILPEENYDAKVAIQSHRYIEHSGNLKNIAAEEKVVEGGQAVQNMQDAVAFGNQNHLPKTTSNKQQHQVEEHSSQHKTVHNKQHNGKKNENLQQWQKHAISLLQVFSARPLSDSESTSFNYKSINNLSYCFDVLENITVGDHSLFDSVSGQVLNKEEIIRKFTTLKNQMKGILSLCKYSATSKNVASDGQNKLRKFLKVSKSQLENETLHYHTKLVHKFLKQLKSAVKDVIKTIDNFTKAVACKGCDMKKMKNEMQNQIHKVKSGWTKIEKTIQLIRSQKQNSGATGVREPEVHSSILKSFGQKSDQAFDGNRDRKQTRSSSSHQKYKEFWKWNHFDPDDFLQEGFFEDNQRKWYKHQKRLKKIGGRIQRLTEEMLLSMDDDDVEDIYEDVDDFADDLEDREIPEQLRTWLSCQTRWWRSRVHRRHRNEDLVKGCGQQLMHWQLRVLCREKSDKHKWDQEEYKYYKFCNAVISSQGQVLNGRHFVLDKSLLQQGAKKIELNYFTQKNDGAEQCMTDSHLNNNSDAFGIGNITYTDHSAYNLDSWFDHHQPDVPIKSDYFANGQIFPQHIHPDHIATGHKHLNDQSMHCLGHRKFSMIMQDDKQMCEK